MKNNTVSIQTIVTPASLRRAAEIMEQIENLQTELTSFLTGSTIAFSSSPVEAAIEVSEGTKGSTSKRTPEQKERIAAALKASWANRKAKASQPVGQPATPESIAPAASTLAVEVAEDALAVRMVKPTLAVE